MLLLELAKSGIRKNTRIRFLLINGMEGFGAMAQKTRVRNKTIAVTLSALQLLQDGKISPFFDEQFDMIIFDPPHIFKSEGKKAPSMSAGYGLFRHESWKEIMRKGLEELFRVLKPDGVFILKWCEIDKPVTDIIKMVPYKPVFGTRTGNRNNTHWVNFIKNTHGQRRLC